MNEKFQLVIASLLHDIGKLGFRAGARGSHSDIAKDTLKEFDDILPKVSSLISLHHQKELPDLFISDGFSSLKKVIIGDWLASSERIGIEKKKDVRKIGLAPIFSKISIFKEKTHQELFYLGMSLNLKNGSPEIYPYPIVKVAGELTKHYKENWDLFTKHLRRIRDYKDDANFMFTYLYSLIKKHFKFVPSAAYFVEPDISLFDHLKIGCALTLALHNYFNSSPSRKEQEITILNTVGQILSQLYTQGDVYREKIQEEPEKKVLFEEWHFFTLIHGDFSGIQNFIHLLSSKYAMKTLKGRSFFFSLLTENFAQYVAEQLDLTQATIIYAGGGHFYIIAHYSEELNTKLTQASIKINKLLVEQFNSNLYLALGLLPLSIEDLVYNISEKWAEINRKTSQKKREKFNEILSSNDEDYFTKLFGPVKGSAKRIQRCIICNSSTTLELIPDSDDQWCLMCKSFKELTDKLRDCKFVKEVPSGKESYNFILNEFEKALNFKEKMTINQREWYSINNLSLEGLLGDKQFPIAFPLNELNFIKSNEDLAEEALHRTGFNKLGILKMDVDSLGKIFQKGLGINSTLSRVSTLSTSLTLFFEGYVPKLIQSEFAESIYLIFSGGDDLFAVGAWDKLINFSFRLYRDFRKFTAFNPDVTVSASIVLESPNFPIMKASLAAEEDLDQAKTSEKFSTLANTKNKISIFGRTLQWNWSWEKENEYQEFTGDPELNSRHRREEVLSIMQTADTEQLKTRILNWINRNSEFEIALILKNILVFLIETKSMSKSMLNKLENSVKGLRRILEDSLIGKIQTPKIWRLKYYLRTILSTNDDQARSLTNFIIHMIEIIVYNNLFEPDSNLQIKTINFMSVAIRWADYLTRK